MKLIFSGILLVFLTTLSYAQPGRGANGTPEEQAQRQTDHMAEELAFSDAQKEKVYEVNLAFAKKMRAVRDSSDGDWTAMRETMMTMRTEHNTELKKYLTEEQFTKWETMQAERRQKRRGEGRRGEGKKKKEEGQDKS